MVGGRQRRGEVSLTGVGKGNVSPKILEYNRYLFILMVGGFVGTTQTYRNVSLKESGEWIVFFSAG